MQSLQKRFDGQLQGLGTDKDGEILAWAFDKKREKGDSEIFTVDGTGDIKSLCT